MFLMDWLKLTKEKGKQMFKVIKICTKRGIEIDVATYSKGYLAVWKRDNDSKAIFQHFTENKKFQVYDKLNRKFRPFIDPIRSFKKGK